MKTIQLLITIVLFSISYTTFGQSTSYIEWNATKNLDYTNFKAKPIRNTQLGAKLANEINIRSKKIGNNPPIYEVVNRMDQNTSWIALKNIDVLREKQIQFDLAELYTRKIRKEIAVLNMKKETDKSKYMKIIDSYYFKMQLHQNKYNGILQEQPDLAKLVHKSILDSLTLYKN